MTSKQSSNICNKSSLSISDAAWWRENGFLGPLDTIDEKTVSHTTPFVLEASEQHAEFRQSPKLDNASRTCTRVCIDTHCATDDEPFLSAHASPITDASPCADVVARRGMKRERSPAFDTQWYAAALAAPAPPLFASTATLLRSGATLAALFDANEWPWAGFDQVASEPCRKRLRRNVRSISLMNFATHI